MAEETCENCRYSRTTVRDVLPYNATEGSRRVKVIDFHCHRLPPQFKNNSDNNSEGGAISEITSYESFPEVAKTWWCGEWKEKE